MVLCARARIHSPGGPPSSVQFAGSSLANAQLAFVRGLMLLGLLVCVPGCIVIKVSVENPILGMNTIAVAPFVNLTQEPPEVVDGRRFALAYFAELQKTKGFQVIPVGVTEVAILKHQLNMTKKDDVLRLAKILKADAVVIGAITDYSPYYPQRIGLQIDWYAPEDWTQPVDPGPSGALGGGGAGAGNGADCKPPVVRGQSIPEPLPTEQTTAEAGPEFAPIAPPNSLEGHSTPTECLPPISGAQPGAGSGLPPLLNGLGGTSMEFSQFDPRIPVMSYTRLFDGADADLVNKLRDYLELRGDRRSGGWEGHLHRSEDFIRFTAHLMIVEMLALHGGVSKSQIVWKWRKYQ